MSSLEFTYDPDKRCTAVHANYGRCSLAKGHMLGTHVFAGPWDGPGINTTMPYTAKGVTVDLPDTSNPKDKFGRAKPPLNLLPSLALPHLALAMANGAEKYGACNFRETKIMATIYVSAALSHMLKYLNGEDYDICPEHNGERPPDCDKCSGVHHLGHAMANPGILLEAIESGTLIDDRPKAGPMTAVMNRLTKKVEK